MSDSYLTTRGRIFDIQRFSIHDGEGIRSVVFLKGCILRCKWCCNPESQHFAIEKMVVQGKEKIIGRDVSVEEVLVEVRQDYAYYRRSGGGMTLSGGEILCQPEFAKNLLKGAKSYGIHTAIESTASLEWEKIENLLPYLDHYLLDIKHMNPHKHKLFTGISNEVILENARKIAASQRCKLSIRIPVIPTFNDTPGEIREICHFAKSLVSVAKIHLLPYHRLGQDKYGYLGREYSLPDILPPENDKMLHLQEVAQIAFGGAVQIGG